MHRQQLIFEMRPKVRMRQAPINSRTLRQMAYDLSDLEGELALTNTNLFRKTGLSWARPDIEEVWTRSGMFRVDRERAFVTDIPVTLPRHDARIGDRFPDETRKVDRLIEERRLLLGRMAARDKDVEYELQTWPSESPAVFHGPGIDWDKVEQGDFNPWLYLDSVRFPFPDPFFYDSCFEPGVTEEDLELTPQYEFVRPWFFNDIDETMVAQLDADLSQTLPWSGSWQAYSLQSKGKAPHVNGPFGYVLSRVEQARRRREKFARQIRDKELSGTQMPLFQEDTNALQTSVDVRHPDDAADTAPGLLRPAHEGRLVVAAGSSR